MSAVIAPDAHVSVAGFTAPASTIDALPGPRPWPIVGNSLQIDARRYHLILEQWAKRYGPLYRVRLGPQTLVVLSDYRVLGELLRRRPDQLRRSSRAASILAEMGPAGVFMAEGTQWQRQRKLVMRAFTPEVVRNFFPTIVLVTERLARYWLDAVSAGRATDVANDLKRYAVDVTSWLALGEDFDTLSTPNHPLQRDVEQVFATFGRRIAAPIPYWRYFKLPADRRLDEANRRTAQRVDELIARTRAWMAEDPQRAKRPSNVLQALLAARDEPGSEFTEDDVRGNVLTMLLAGEDTTANTIAWILYFAGHLPEVAAKLAAEADSVLGDQPVLSDYSGVDKLRYTEAVATEAMRLKPVGPLQALQALCDLRIGELHLPAGTIIVSPVRDGALREQLFPQAHKFLPERWLNGDAKAIDDTRRAIFPFGGGPRYCPGRYLAMVEIKLVVSMLFRNFAPRLTADPATIGEHYHLTMGPDTLPMALEQRSPA